MKRLQAFVVSLPAREDRRQTLREWWSRMPDAAHCALQFIPGVEVPAVFTGYARVAKCDLACAMGHRKAVALAEAQGLDVVLVLEDDAQWLPPASLLDFMTGPLAQYQGWHTCNLGGCNAQWRPASPTLRAGRILPGLMAVKGMVTTHAVLYHKRSFEDILCAIPTEQEILGNYGTELTNPRPFDQWLSSYGVQVTPDAPIFSQSGSTSDILGVPHGVSIDGLIKETYERLRNTVPVC